jgi:hypothetical protein
MNILNELGGTLDAKRAFDRYLPAKLTLDRFDEDLRKTCQRVLEDRRSLIEGALGEGLEFEDGSYFAVPGEKDLDLWGCIGKTTTTVSCHRAPWKIVRNHWGRLSRSGLIF